MLVFDTIEGPPYLEIKQTLHVPLPLTSRLETLIPFGKGFVVAGGGINGYLGVYENMVSKRGGRRRVGEMDAVARTELYIRIDLSRLRRHTEDFEGGRRGGVLAAPWTCAHKTPRLLNRCIEFGVLQRLDQYPADNVRGLFDDWFP